MSLISKLFRKAEPGDAPAETAAQLHVGTAPASTDDLRPSVVEQPDERGADEQPAETEALPAVEQAVSGPAPGALAVADDAWWEEAAPAPDPGPQIAVEAHPTEAVGVPAGSPGTPTGGPDLDVRADAEESGTRPLAAGDLPVLATLRSPRGLAAAALRDVGRVRSVNQDSVFMLLTTLPRESGDVSIGLFVVADGMGGHHGGEVASRMAIGVVAHHVLAELVVPALTDGATEALQPLIVAAVQEANRAIWEHAQLIGSDMGTTCTVALLLGRALYVGHVGDSRAYLATPTGLQLITNDHSTVGRLIQLGQLDPAEAREHPLRSQLYRTVGQQPEIHVDFIYQQIGAATHLLLASDGLWSMLGDDVMLDVLEHAIWPQDACNELIARANLAGGDDNISAIVVSLPTQI
ncbi:MAG TPA: protein phosphatase 2C domain-containing protein [Roseiflexaceae bacterium]